MNLQEDAMARQDRISSRVGALVEAKERREKRRISYRVLASEVGVNLGTVQAWMTNTVTRFDAPTLLALCRYFDCDISDLIQIEHDVEVPAHG